MSKSMRRYLLVCGHIEKFLHFCTIFGQLVSFISVLNKTIFLENKQVRIIRKHTNSQLNELKICSNVFRTHAQYVVHITGCYDVHSHSFLRPAVLRHLRHLLLQLPVPELSQSCSVRRHFLEGNEKRETRKHGGVRDHTQYKRASSPTPCPSSSFPVSFFVILRTYVVLQPEQMSWTLLWTFLKYRFSALVVSFDPSSACRNFVPVCHCHYDI